MTRSPDIDYVIARALSTRHDLPPSDQLRVLRGVAEMAEEGGELHETATQAIFHLQRAEHEQLRLDQLFAN
jgi:hypothetical protein